MRHTRYWVLAFLSLSLWSGIFQTANGQTEIEIWLSGEPGTVDVYTDLANAYMAENPDVEIVTTFIGNSLFSPTLVPALTAGQGPDIFQFGTGPGQPAAVINSGLATDLTPYFFQYGWDEVIPPEIVNYTSSKGKLWAVGHEVETTAMFYNKEIFDELGLSVPETAEEFAALVTDLQEAGYDTPIGLGGADQWPISHWQSLLFGRYAGPDGIDDVMFGEGRWDQAEFVEASAELQRMAREGYFGPNPLARGNPEVLDAFWREEIPMVFTGPWVIPDAQAALGEEFERYDVFQVPPLREGQQIHPTEDIGSGFYVSAASEHPDVAADVLDFYFFRPESRIMLLNEGGSVPVGSIDDLLEQSDAPELANEMIRLVDDYRDNGTIHAFLDTVQPANVTSVTYDGLQALLVDRMTPEQFVAEIQAAWEEAKANGDILERGGIDQP